MRQTRGRARRRTPEEQREVYDDGATGPGAVSCQRLWPVGDGRLRRLWPRLLLQSCADAHHPATGAASTVTVHTRRLAAPAHPHRELHLVRPVRITSISARHHAAHGLAAGAAHIPPPIPSTARSALRAPFSAALRSSSSTIFPDASPRATRGWRELPQGIAQSFVNSWSASSRGNAGHGEPTRPDNARRLCYARLDDIATRRLYRAMLEVSSTACAATQFVRSV